MAKKKKSKREDKEEKVSFLSQLSSETLNTILGVFSVLVLVFLILSAFHAGGKVGILVYSGLTYLFGIGYYIIPLACLLLSISLFQPRERNFAMPQVIGSLIFFVSALGITNLVLAARGGVVGNLISKPLVSLFDFYASLVILVALIVVSLLIIFDTTIKIDLIHLYRKLFRKAEPTADLIAIETKAVEDAVERIEKNQPLPTSGERQDKQTPKRFDENEAFIPMITKRSGRTWSPPPLSLLDKDRGRPGVGDIKANANLIKRTLLNFGIMVEMDEISIGPSVTRYALKPAEGVKLSKILGLQNNLELALAAHPVRIEAPIPGKSLVGIEVPNTAKSIIGLGSLLSEDGYTNNDKPLLVALGRDITGTSHFSNLSKMPHLLIAGATGSGKSVTIHSIINSLIFRNPPDNLKFIMIDPKRVELTLYNNIPHLLTPVVTEPKKAILALKWATKEMERRYEILEKESVRDIESYHKNVFVPKLKNAKPDEELDPMPFIVVVIDELADLMQSYPRELEAAVVRLAQMSRAVGIHIILSTQRPSVNVITGLIKANIPSRIALQVSSQIDSRTILDTAGAEKLLGAGDMLYLSGDMGKPVRIQSAYITEKEVKEVSKYLRDEYADELRDEINFADTANSNAVFSANLDEENFDDDDELYEEARTTVLHAGKASTSFLQRKLRVGYARAARLIDLLEERGVIGPGFGAKPREVIGAESGGSSDVGMGNTDEGEEVI